MHWVVHIGETHSLNQGQNDSCWWHQVYAQHQAAPLDASLVLDGESIPCLEGAAVAVLLPARQSQLSRSPDVAEEAAEE